MNDSAVLSYIVAACGLVYVFVALITAVMLANLDFFDSGNGQSLLVAALFFSMPIVLAMAVFIAIHDSKKAVKKRGRT